MRKKLFVFLFLFFGLCYANSLFIYDNSFIPEWTLQVVYKEKYFENSIYYREYNFFDFYENIDNSYTETLKGLEHNILLRLGMPNEYILNIDFDFIFQKVWTYDYNNLQTVNFMVEKKIDFINIIAGLKIPLWFDVEPNPYLIDKRDQLNLLTGLTVDLNFDSLKIFFIFFNEENLCPDDYFGTRNIILTTGFDFISNEMQKVGLYVENDLKINVFNNLLNYIYYFIPQIKISFYDDFYFIVGVEFYLLAKNVFLNKSDKPQYVFKLNYIINSDKKEKKKEKQEEKVKFEKKKWWQIEGVDDEMIPDSWKEMEEPKSK